MKLFQYFILILMCFCSAFVYAGLEIPMYSTYTGRYMGTIMADDTIYGLLLTPHLQPLKPGPHGFHIHQIPCCQDQGRAAGCHYDPVRTYRHRGPYKGNGHLGDLAVLVVDWNGKARLPVLAPRLKLADIRNRAIIIHEDGDNYADFPRLNGGGGPMIACGIVPFHSIERPVPAGPLVPIDPCKCRTY